MTPAGRSQLFGKPAARVICCRELQRPGLLAGKKDDCRRSARPRRHPTRLPPSITTCFY